MYKIFKATLHSIVSNIFEQKNLRASPLEPLFYLQTELCRQILTFLAYDSNLGH
jgi:hypothetical protein